MDAPFSRIAPDVALGRDVKIVGWANLYGCAIGSGALIMGGVTVGAVITRDMPDGAVAAGVPARALK